MGEQIQHTYPCMNRGCPNGFQSPFSAAPPEWFREKGINTPKNCPDCKQWKKAQIDSIHRCKSCGFGIRQSQGAKIMHHKKQGVYTPPSECRHCEQREKPPKAIRKRPPSPEKLTRRRQPQRLAVVAYERLSAYRRGHYGKHIIGHPLSEVGQPRRDDELVSATTLVDPDASSLDLYAAGTDIAERVDDGIFQFESQGNILKVTIVNNTHVELTSFGRRGNGEYELLSSYDEMSIEKANGKIESGDWT